MSDISQQEFERIVSMCRDVQGGQILTHVKNVLTKCMQPSARDDWRTIDLVIAALTMQWHKANDESFKLLIQTARLMTRPDGMADQIYHQQTWKLALTLLVITHAQFVIDGGVYRDGNADWYFDRLYSAIEGTISITQEERDKVVEKTLAKVRSADRQAPVQGSGDRQSGEGGQGPESAAGEVGKEGAQSVQ